MTSQWNEGQDTVMEVHAVHALGTPLPRCVETSHVLGGDWVRFEWKKRVITRDPSTKAHIHIYQLEDDQEVMLIMVPSNNPLMFPGCYTSAFGPCEGVFPKEEVQTSCEADESLKNQDYEEYLDSLDGDDGLDWQVCVICKQWWVYTQDDQVCPICNPKEKED